MIQHPPGIYQLRFCTVSRPLPNNALLEFAGGRGLPSGTASPVEVPIIQVRSPAGALTELKGGSITTESSGIYHALMEMLEAGEWVWEGQGWTSTNKLVTSTGELPWTISAALKN